MPQTDFVLKGQILFCRDQAELATYANAYLAYVAGAVAGVFDQLPPQYASLPVIDYGEQLIIPGLIDLHLHAPQYAFAGLGMDLPLLPWLATYAYPEEARYADTAYAAAAYARFCAHLRRSFTTRAAIFATCHSKASSLLADLLEQTGLIAYLGRVSMDRDLDCGLAEGDTADEDARDWLLSMQGKSGRIRPIVTPRFIPSCSPGLLKALGDMAAEFELPVQSHLSENMEECELVASMYPEAACYGAVYDAYGLFGAPQKTVMAHCVHCPPLELELMRERGVFVAHCPQSNINLTSGAAPVKNMLELGIPVGLGTDMAGGAHLSLFRAIQDAIAASKLRVALLKPEERPLTLNEAFYLATKGGGAFFGSVGSFEPGYALDALVLDDSHLRRPWHTLAERLQRAIYLLDESMISAKYVDGRQIL